MISIVTGTLNRGGHVEKLIKNTVDSNENLELVLIDGGFLGNPTSNFIKELNHPRIKLIEVGGRSTYPEFMNLGIENSSHDWICQWNDDVLLVNDWNEVIDELKSDDDFYLFNWKYGNIQDMTDETWLSINENAHKEKVPNLGWCLVDAWETAQLVVMNYGIYNKRVFKKIGMYNLDYKYYYCDTDMSMRAHMFGFKKKSLPKIKVCSYEQHKVAQMNWRSDETIYNKYIEQYRKGIIDSNYIKLLK